jgi:succinyl-CoA synthetase beta subunit
MDASRERGWVSEADAKSLLAEVGLTVPRFTTVTETVQIQSASADIGFPLAAKVVSTRILHKSDLGGVKTNITGPEELAAVFETFRRLDGFEAMLIEEMVSGLELIIGAKIDDQFGPVVMLGMGGTGVEIYQDISLRMAPVGSEDVTSMIKCLKGGRLLSGYRGGVVVNRDELIRTIICFSEFVMAAAEMIESIDLNPVMCSAERCVVADARIMLKTSNGSTSD